MSLSEDEHRAVSLLVRDLTLSARQLHDLSRSYDALAGTYKQVLARECSDVLMNSEQGKTVGSGLLLPHALQLELPADPFRTPLSEDYD